MESSPPLGDAALNALFAASWPDHEPTDFGARLRHSLLWVAAFREYAGDERDEHGGRDDDGGRVGCDEHDEPDAHHGRDVRGRLVGFVNVLGDGGVHAFVLDTTVHPSARRRGLGVRLVRRAADEASRAGARWLHVDYEEHLSGFYARCGFRPTAAGLRRLG
ncbi:GNAT family N-acetyltransferase [Streptomyces marispadix]|uniref:GNAT family N-acetyltransferase n=1 Tax=Streptomyces marispadix TaxID=2922868 RepID=UPI003555D524